MKYMLFAACFGLSALLTGCANNVSPSGPAIEFKTLTMERARARAGRAAIMGLSDRTANDGVAGLTISRIGGRTISANYHAIILDAVPQSIGVRLDDGSERFFRMTLQPGKYYLIMSHRYTESDTAAKPPVEKLDVWVRDIDSNAVVYGEKSASSSAATQEPRFAQLIERHVAHLRSLFLDAS